MSNQMSDLIANNLPIDMGFLGLESFISDAYDNKTKTKEAKLMRVNTCQTATQVAQYPQKGSAKRTEHGKSFKEAFAKPNKLQIRHEDAPNESLTSDFKNRLRQIQKAQEQMKQQFLAQIDSLTKKVSEVQFRNVTLDVETHLLKAQLGESHKLIKQLHERLVKGASREQRQKEQKEQKMQKQRKRLESKEEEYVPKYIRPYGHQRFKSVGEEIGQARFPYC